LHLRSDLRPLIILGVAAFLAVALIFSLAGNVSFWHDECDFLHHRSLADPIGLFTPHNDHPVALSAAMYRVVVDLFGTQSYAPYLGLVLIAHVATTTGLFVLIRQDRLWAGLGAAVVLLFLGTGGGNLFWAFQITFVGSTAFGVWALWAADRNRWGSAGAMFTAAIFCSLTGAAFLAGGIAIAAHRQIRGAWWLTAPVAALGIWWVVFARDWVRPPDWAVYDYGSPGDLSSWAGVPLYVFQSVFEVVSDISGLRIIGATAIVAAGIAAAVWAWRRGWRPSAIHTAAIVGFFTFMTMVGVVRSAEADGLRPRFVYVGAVFALMLIPRIPRRPLWVATAIFLFAIALGTNILAMAGAAAMETARSAGPLACTP
jgi:hypothetical protein